MRKSDERFLEALRAGLKNESVCWEEEISQEEWRELFGRAQEHHLLPVVFQAVYQCRSAQHCAEMFAAYKNEIKRQVIVQAIRTEEFLRLYGKLQAEGLNPLVVKGLICRELYPDPDSRISADEDMLLQEDCFARGHELLLKYGMCQVNPEENPENAHEVSYIKQDSFLHIELHKSLFAPDSDAYGDFNGCFADVFERAQIQEIHGVKVHTLGCTDHLLYLICHALKHFLHSGFGIRQVCDIVRYAQFYGDQIDWEQVFSMCRAVRGERFAAAVFRIGERYFDFSPEKAGMSVSWRKLSVDEAPLLADLLESGVYGKSNADRLHSSTITLNAVAADRQGRKGRAGVLKTLFPPLKYMEGRRPWLKKYPFLLPAAWIGRIIVYGKEIRSGESAGGSIKIGDRRLELLREYRIIR